jgi:predicted DsbA family dithiol-disulfide isomerase
MDKIKVEIWSDVMCPFCYIGKRRFEKALSEFPASKYVDVEWKSFQLNPNMKTDTAMSTVDYLAKVKGWSKEQARESSQYVTDMAKASGLEYHMDKAVVANSFDAHRFIQFAKKHGKGDPAEERLFKAYFTEGKNTADHSVLAELADEIGLNGRELLDLLKSDALNNDVEHDLDEARQLGINAVPFFVFNRRIAVSGAQDPKTFLGALEKASELLHK